MKIIKIFISLAALAFFSACSTTVPVFVMESKVINGGDVQPRAQFTENKISDVNKGDCVVFYKGKDQTKYYYTASSVTEVEIGKTIMTELKDVKREPVPTLLFTKYTPITQIDKTSGLYKDKKNIPFNYNISLQSIGSAKVSEIVIVDALPDKYELTDVQYWWTFYFAAARVKDSGFDQITWEVKEKDNKKFLIIKIVMEKDPMGTFGWMDWLSLQLVGNLNLE